MEEETKSNQRSKILRYIREHGSITSLEAQTALHIVDGRKRISEMIRMGIPIVSSYYYGRNADGKNVRYKVYTLEDE